MGVNVMLRSIAHMKKTGRLGLGVVMLVSADDAMGKRTSWETVTVMRSFSPPRVYASVYCGGSCFPRKAREAHAIPSRHTRSYLRASQRLRQLAPPHLPRTTPEFR
jgi:hypothetical protein